MKNISVSKKGKDPTFWPVFDVSSLTLSAYANTTFHALLGLRLIARLVESK